MVAAVAKPPDNRDAEIRVYSYYRDGEIRGSNLLYRLLRVLKDGASQIALSEHLADETRHAWLWTELIRDLGAEPVPVEDGYQVRLGKRAGLPRHRPFPADPLRLRKLALHRESPLARPNH